MLNEQSFTIVDVETTGGNSIVNRVIEIGLLRTQNGKVVEQFQTFINPQMPIPEFITDMTGISDYDVLDAPKFADLAEVLIEKFQDSIFVAHNSSFDYGFLREEFARSNLAFNLPQLCTVKLSRALFPEYKRHNLTEIIDRFEFECENRHRAFDDAKVLWDFLQILPEKFENETVEKAYKKVLKIPRNFPKNPLTSPIKTLNIVED